LINLEGVGHDCSPSVAALRLYSHGRNDHSHRAGIDHSHRRNTQDSERTTKGGVCAGYLNAVFDFIDSNPDLEIMRDFNVADMMQCFQRYAPKHNREPADKAVVNALVGEGYVKRH
jgi:hypothetical protein